MSSFCSKLPTGERNKSASKVPKSILQHSYSYSTKIVDKNASKQIKLHLFINVYLVSATVTSLCYQNIIKRHKETSQAIKTNPRLKIHPVDTQIKHERATYQSIINHSAVTEYIRVN